MRQGAEEKYRPELYVIGDVKPALEARIAELAKQYPGIAVETRGDEFRIAIPNRYRVGHEAHFAQVTNQFFEYLRHGEALPAWENPNMLAKYFVSTNGTALASS